MIQQHTGDNIPIGMNRTVSNRLRYPLLSYQLFQNIHLLFQKVKRYLWINLVIQLCCNKPADNLCFRKQIIGRLVLLDFCFASQIFPAVHDQTVVNTDRHDLIQLGLEQPIGKSAYADILHSSLIHKRLPNQEPYPKVDLDFFFFHSHHPLVTGQRLPYPALLCGFDQIPETLRLLDQLIQNRNIIVTALLRHLSDAALVAG